MSYGAFVKLEEAIEGLVHISEMSWTKRISHPNELVQIDDEIEVVLGINKEKQEISLGVKKTQKNPWDNVADRYPPETIVSGTVRNRSTTAISSRSRKGSTACCTSATCRGPARSAIPARWSKRVSRSNAGRSRSIRSRRRIALGLKQIGEDPWASDIPGKYQPGQVVTGTVTKLTNFGVFVGLENGLEGLFHISELADHKVENPEEIVKVGEKIEVKPPSRSDERKIGLSRKRVTWSEDEGVEAGAAASSSGGSNGGSSGGGNSSVELRGGVGGESGPLIKPSA